MKSSYEQKKIITLLTKSLVVIFCLAIVLSINTKVQAQATPSQPENSITANQTLTPWTLIKQKVFPNYKVEIYQRMTIGKFPAIDSMKARITPLAGGSVVQHEAPRLNPDYRSYVTGWVSGLFDLDGDGYEDLMLQNSSGGIHCCFGYSIYSLKSPLKKIGEISLKDCGEQIKLKDLNGDKKLEIIACNPDFAYINDLPFADSPFPPSIYTLKDGQYQKADLEFKQVFLDDIKTQRDTLAKGYQVSAVLQIVSDYLALGDEANAWKEFDTLYQGDDKEAVKTELMKRVPIKATGI